MNQENTQPLEQAPNWTTHIFSPEVYHPSIPLPTFIARDPGAAAYLKPVLEYFIRNNNRFALITAENAQRLNTIDGLVPQPGLPRVSLALVPGDHDPVQGILPLLKTFKWKNPALKIAVAEDYPHSTDALLLAMEKEKLIPAAIFVNSNYTIGDTMRFLKRHGLSQDQVPCRVVPNPAFDEHYMLPPRGTIRDILHIPKKEFLLGIFGMPEQDIPSVNGGQDHNTIMMQSIRAWLLTRRAPITIVYRPHGRSAIKVHPAFQDLPPHITPYQFTDDQWKTLGVETPSVWPDCTAIVTGRSTLGQELALVRDRHHENLPIPIEAIFESEFGEIPHDRNLSGDGVLLHASSPTELQTLLSRVRQNPARENAQLRLNKGTFIKKTGWMYQGSPVIAGTLQRLQDER